VKLTTTRYDKANAIFFNAQSDVGFKFLTQAIADLAAGGKFTFATLQWAGVWAKVHTQGWRFNFKYWQGFWIVDTGNRFTNVRFSNTSYGNDVTSNRTGNFFAG